MSKKKNIGPQTRQNLEVIRVTTTNIILCNENRSTDNQNISSYFQTMPCLTEETQNVDHSKAQIRKRQNEPFFLLFLLKNFLN